MPRGPRFDAPGYRHHVMNRGAGHATIFADSEDLDNFLKLVGEATARFRIQVHGYALMTDHFHLMIETPRGHLSEAMAFIGGRYTRLFNARHGTDGPLFRGRFKSRLVETTDYWRHLLAYLHLNPVRAGIVSRPEDAYLTSCRAYYCLPHHSPAWLRMAEVTEMFGSPRQIAEYTERSRTNTEAAPVGFDPVALWKPAPAPDVPVVTTDVPTEVALAELYSVIGTKKAVVVAGARTGNPRLWVTAWWLYMRTGMSLRTVGKRYLVKASTVSRWLPRLFRHANTNPEIGVWMAKLRDMLVKSTTIVVDRDP